MADKALKKVEDQLNCSICLDTYTDPKLLQCFHVYCQGCLAKLVVQDQQGHLVLTCPICRQVTPIPANGVTGLQPAFHINHLLDILNEHKKEEGPAAERDLACLAGKKRDNQLCSEHVGKALELYCETCEELICFHGIMKKGKHHSHNYKVLDEAFEKYKEKITPSLEPMEKQLVTINKALAQCDSYCVEVSDERAAVEADIHKTISRLQKVVHEALEVRKTELIGHLHQLTEDKLKDLAVQRDQIETTQAQLGSCIDFIKESFKTTSSQGEVLRINTSITQRAKELTNISQPTILEPRLKDDIVFLPSGVEDIPEQCRNCGQVSIKCTTDNGVNFEGKPLMKQVKSLKSELASVIPWVIIGNHDFPEGVDIAREIIEKFKLNPRRAFCETSRVLALRERYREIRFLVQSIQTTHSDKEEALNDEVIMAAIKVLAGESREEHKYKQAEKLMQMMISDRSKFEAMVKMGKLKNAYLIAIRAKLVDEIRELSDIAYKAGNFPVGDICERWLRNAPSW